MIRKPLVFALLPLTLLGGSYALPAFSQACKPEAASESTSRRRRLGDETPTANCVDANAEKNTESVEKKRVPKKSTPTRKFHHADNKNERRKNQVSKLPRPRLQDYVASVPVPDRWRIVDALGYEEHWYDPYNRNALKADRPVIGDDWFFNLGIISDSVYETRDLVTPVGSSSTRNPGAIDVFGASEQRILSQSLATEFVLYKGDTVFRPPDYEFRITPVFNANHTTLEEVQGINVDPARGETRADNHVGLQAAFIDVHLRNVSDRYDFDSLRVGIQPFNSDFRGFLFQDNQLGIRLFGTRDNNIFQYNLAFFQRLEKDTNSGLNDVSAPLRKDYIFTANVYWQDLFKKGFFSQFSFTHNINNEDETFYFDNNGFIARPASIGREAPRAYDVSYLGYSGDGHFGRHNLSTSVYYAFGSGDPGVFVSEEVDISALFFAAEYSMDFDWIRPRFSLLYASGDKNPFDDEANGFDAIFENPQFAGSDTSYWIRQNMPLVGGGRVTLSSRNGILNSLRSSKEQGQSNFTNPGTRLLGVGVDMDLTPELRMSANANQLYFDKTEVLEVARNQSDIDNDIGQDVSLSLIYRPWMSQNIVFRASYARLFGGQGFNDLFEDENLDYFLFNAVLSY